MNDHRAIAIVRASAFFRGASAMLRTMEVAWLGSASRGVVNRAATQPVRFWSIAALTASIVVLAVAPLGTAERPLAWLVPSAVAAMSLLFLVGAPR